MFGKEVKGMAVKIRVVFYTASSSLEVKLEPRICLRTATNDNGEYELLESKEEEEE